MESDNLKTIWMQQDAKLNDSMKLSSKILKNTFKQQANGVIENMLKWEYFSLIEFFVFLIFMGISTYKAINDWRFLVSGIFIISFLVLCIAVTIKGIQQLNTIDLFSRSIIDTKQIILKYNKQAQYNTKIFFYSIPPVIITFLLVGVNFVRNINLFDFPILLAVLSVCIITISYIILSISYKTLYLRKIKLIENSLAELEKFREE